MTIRYAHTNIIAEDWKRLSTFYREVFQCVPVPPERDQSGEWLERCTGVRGAHLRGVHLRLPGCGSEGPTLEIYQYDRLEPRLPAAANRLGYGHLAFAVDDVEEVQDQVLAHGGSALGEMVTRDLPDLGRITVVYVQDPEGNILELQHWSKSGRPAPDAPAHS